MIIRHLILGVLLSQCVVFAHTLGLCSLCYDPNSIIDDPNTLDNGLFECGDPNNSTLYGTTYNFEPPLFWERSPHPDSQIWSNSGPNTIDCYAALHTSFNPSHLRVKWSIPTPFEGETFTLLSTGGFDNVADEDIAGAAISQKVLLNEGDIIFGAYFLGTTDYPEFNDYGRIIAHRDSNYVYPDPNELVINRGFDSDTSWTKTGLWTIGDPNISDPSVPDPNLPDANIATYNVYQQQIIDPNVDSILSQTISLVPQATYRVSIDVLTGIFDPGSDAFMVTLGDETYNMTAYANTTITQLFSPTSGNTLMISWGNEGSINIDNISVKFAGQYPADEFVIAFESLGSGPDQIPKYGSTGDWVEFEHVIEPNQVGPYILKCEVVDFRDAVVSTYLAVDGLGICRNGKPLSDLNDDCRVNLIDYSIFLEAWLSFCPDIVDPNIMDPNDIADPNIPCQLADINNSWFVDSNDLVIMSDEWLQDKSDQNNP
jgi:hypothetical protein